MAIRLLVGYGDRVLGGAGDRVFESCRLPVGVLALVVIAYAALIFASGFITLINPPTERLYAPIAIPLVSVVYRVIATPLLRRKRRGA